MSIQTAIKCFDENIKRYGNAKTDPEKYNLYNGLSKMAHAIERVADDIHRLKRTVDGIERKLSHL